MSKVIDLNKTVYEICRDSPEILQIMKELGFDNIAAPGMLNTAGRFMTIPKGASMKGINIDRVKQLFMERGYEVKE